MEAGAVVDTLKKLCMPVRIVSPHLEAFFRRKKERKGCIRGRGDSNQCAISRRGRGHGGTFPSFR